jgi:hypothetical protein
MSQRSIPRKPSKETTSVRLDSGLRKRADDASVVLGLGGLNTLIVIALEDYLDRFDEEQRQKERDDLLREAVPALKAIAEAVQALLEQGSRSPERESSKE